MHDNAVKKITDEIEANKDNAYIQVIGKMLLKYLEAVPESAEKFLTVDKTIGKSFEEMKKAARKKAKDNVAMLTEQEGFEIVLKYFGIENINGIDLGSGPDYSAVNGKVTPNSNYAQEKKPARFDVNLEDLL